MPSSVKSAGSTSSSEDGLLLRDGIGVNIDKMGFTGDYGDMIEQAINDPSVLSREQLIELARTVSAKAFEQSIFSHPISSILITICDKDKSKVFSETLTSWCRSWFTDRNSKLRPHMDPNANKGKCRWPPFVAFITDFYLNLKSKLRGVVLNLDDEIEINESNEVPADEIHHKFADLLFDSCMDILVTLKTTDYPTIEIQCLLYILRSVGKHMEKDKPELMKKLIEALRETFLGPVSGRLPDGCVKIILELIEWAVSGWQFNQHQFDYYCT